MGKNKVVLKVIGKHNTAEYKVEKGETLLEGLKKAGIYVPFPCGGNGRCGKCRIIIKEPVMEITDEDRDHISKEELDQGCRLACRIVVKEDMSVVSPIVVGEAQIMTAGIGLHDLQNRHTITNPDSKEFQKGFGIAVDIGTTTLVVYLVRLNTGEVAGIQSGINPQQINGADIISRINYAAEDSSRHFEMRNLIISGINAVIREAVHKAGIDSENIIRAVISGNTTMLHFFLGLEVEGLGRYPYTPVTTDSTVMGTQKSGLEISQEGQVIVLPSVSAFIGADILAGVAATGIYKARNYSLLIDLGTNGELVLGCGDRLYACSAAMGPAFEGANILHGTASIEGAIDKITLSYNEMVYSTIGGLKPIGICGSGIIDAVAGLFRAGIIDGTGKMSSKEQICECSNNDDLIKRITTYKNKPAFIITEGPDNDPIIFTQEDIRQVQLAKAAVSTGIDMLIRKAGITYDSVKTVYLAGGFGGYLDIDNAVIIGLIPKELKGKIVSAGNTSGVGAVKCLLNPDLLAELNDIKQRVDFFDLGSEKNFEDMFINSLRFEPFLG